MVEWLHEWCAGVYFFRSMPIALNHRVWDLIHRVNVTVNIVMWAYYLLSQSPSGLARILVDEDIQWVLVGWSVNSEHSPFLKCKKMFCAVLSIIPPSPWTVQMSRASFVSLEPWLMAKKIRCHFCMLQIPWSYFENKTNSIKFQKQKTKRCRARIKVQKIQRLKYFVS